MPPKTLFVPKEFSNELTDLIEQNPTVEKVLCHNLLSQTCRNEGLKFLNFFYNPEELEKKNANLPNLDHLIDLALDKDATVDVPEEGSNSIGQINRNASNILSGPSKRLRDLAIKDPQRRLFRKLRGFIKTKSAKNTMFAGHFQRILENYLSAYESEFKPQSNEFYKDDFSMKRMIDFMIKNIKILSYRDFLTHFITTFAKSFPDDSNYALEEILSRAGRYLFALQDFKDETDNHPKASKDNKVVENDTSSENNETSERNSNDEKSSTEDHIESGNEKDIKNSEMYKQYYQFEEKIQPISIEEKRLPLPIYMHNGTSKPIPPFNELYKEFQLFLEDFQLSHPTKRSNCPGIPLPSKKVPLPPAQISQKNGDSLNNLTNYSKRSSIEPDFFRKNNENANKKRNQSSTFRIPGLISLDELDPKKKSKQRETQSSFDMINRSPDRKSNNNNNFRRSVNFQKTEDKIDIDKSSNCSDSDNSEKKSGGRHKRSYSLKQKTKPKTKVKDDKKSKFSDPETQSIEEAYLDDNGSNNKNDSKGKSPIIYHYNVTKRRFSSMNDFENTMKDFVHYNDDFKEKIKSKAKKNKFNSDIATQSVFFLISLVRNAINEDPDFYQIFRKNEALLQLLLICGTFCDDESRLASEVFTIVRSIIEEEDSKSDEKDGNDNNKLLKKDNDDQSSDDGSDNENNNNSNSSDSDKESSKNNENGNNNNKHKKDWKVPDFVADFAEYFTFDPYNVTQKMIAAFQIFWNYRSQKYEVYDSYCYSKYISQSSREKNLTLAKALPFSSSNSTNNFNSNAVPNADNIIAQMQQNDLILDYPTFEGVIYRKPPGKTPLEVMTPIFFTEPPLSDTFNHHVRRILTNLGKKRKNLAGNDITKSEYIENILQIDIIYIEFMRNTFDLSFENPDFQRLHVINAIEKMLEMYPCNNNYWQNHNTIARPMLNGHIQKLSRWSMKYDFLVVGKNKELSNIAFLLPGPKVATAANYAQTTFDIENLKSRFKNKLFKIDLGWPSNDEDEEEEDYGPVSELEF